MRLPVPWSNTPPALWSNAPPAWHRLVAATAPDLIATSVPVLSDSEKQAVTALARRHGLCLRLSAGSWRLQSPKIQQLTMAALRQAARLSNIVTALTDANIPVAAFKGPVLALALHGSLAGRDPGDLDILVPADRIPRALAVLADLGFVAAPPFDRPWSPQGWSRLTAAACDVPLYHPAWQTPLELHWRWHRNPGLPPLDPARVWASGNRVHIGSVAVPVPDPVEHFIYLCCHGAGHYWYRLKWLDDIRHTLADPSWLGGDWAVVAARARALGVIRPVAAACLMAAWLDGADLPGVIQSFIDDDPAIVPLTAGRAFWCMADLTHHSPPFKPGLGRFITNSLWQWQLLPSWRRRWNGMIWGQILGPNERDIGMINLPAGLGWAYPALRPLLWAGRHLPRRPARPVTPC